MATTTAYLVEAGEYEDRHVMVISLDRAAAQRYADHHNIQRDRPRDLFAEVSEIECISTDWAPPVVEVEPEYCDNCHATTADECFCAEQIHYLMRLAANAHQRCSTPGGHVPRHYVLQAALYQTAQPYPPRSVYCSGCVGAGTGARCCICGGLR